jgi:hypothetical protein
MKRFNGKMIILTGFLRERSMKVEDGYAYPKRARKI